MFVILWNIKKDVHHCHQLSQRLVKEVRIYTLHWENSDCSLLKFSLGCLLPNKCYVTGSCITSSRIIWPLQKNELVTKFLLTSGTILCKFHTLSVSVLFHPSRYLDYFWWNKNLYYLMLPWLAWKEPPSHSLSLQNHGIKQQNIFPFYLCCIKLWLYQVSFKTNIQLP
jgi:hypothetical protein